MNIAKAQRTIHAQEKGKRQENNPATPRGKRFEARNHNRQRHYPKIDDALPEKHPAAPDKDAKVRFGEQARKDSAARAEANAPWPAGKVNETRCQ
jgi:hypothetical protein